jgi:ABC transport system ATP-binding/permease protein
MNYLTLENVTKSYGEKVLFKNVSLTIEQGQKIALVAKNGSGKTTLLRVLAGIEGSEGEQSKILIKKDIVTGFLNQDPKFEANQSVIDAIFQSGNPKIEAIKKYEVAVLHPDNQDAMNTALAQMDDLKAWEIESTIKEILTKLKLNILEQKIGTLSGGQVKRVALAKLLINDPDFLILDEPTNHLDLEMIEWLEVYLKQASITLFMVTHDRYFLDNVCDHIVELDNGSFFKYKGGYANFLEKKEARLENEAINFDKTKKLFKKELDWMRRQPQARSTKAKSRIDDFGEISEQIANQRKDESLQMDIKTTWLGSKIIELYNVSKSYDEKIIFRDFSYKFKRKERVGIIGNNGTGKSTFLNMITGKVKPDTGKVVIGDTIEFGYYNQDGMKLNEDKRMIDVITDIAEYIPLEKGKKMTASSLLERFLFSRAQQQVYVSQLSGGEKRRLYLLTIIMKNPNFLILDEPTNDLDIVTLNVLEQFLEEFPGCLVIVTHDRYFMDNLVDHLFIFDGNGNIQDFNGNYTEYIDLKKSKPTEQSVNKVENTVKKTNAEVYEMRKEVKKVETEIARLEKRKKEINDQFEDAKIPIDKINTLSKELQTILITIAEKELLWMELSENI